MTNPPYLSLVKNTKTKGKRKKKEVSKPVTKERNSAGVISFSTTRQVHGRSQCKHMTVIPDPYNDNAQVECADCGEMICAVAVIARIGEEQRLENLHTDDIKREIGFSMKCRHCGKKP